MPANELWRPLLEKYGRSKNQNQLINAAIRAELPGGRAALDLLDFVRHWASGDRNRAAQQTLAGVRSIVDSMADEIRTRYKLPGNPAQPSRD